MVPHLCLQAPKAQTQSANDSMQGATACTMQVPEYWSGAQATPAALGKLAYGQILLSLTHAPGTKAPSGRPERNSLLTTH
jgi:hypothetical protein